MSLVIGVGGRLTAGKDVFADYLVDCHGFVKLGMSDVLADALYVLDPWIPIVEVKRPSWWLPALVRKLFYGEPTGELAAFEFRRYQDLVDTVGYVEAKKNHEVRRLLQVLGTEVGRQLISEKIWVDVARRRISEQLDAGRDVVITGIRYRNELEMIQYLNAGPHSGTTVWVERPGINSSSSSGHSSEESLSSEDFEYILWNDSTIEALTRRADDLLEEIRQDYLA